MWAHRLSKFGGIERDVTSSDLGLGPLGLIRELGDLAQPPNNSVNTVQLTQLSFLVINCLSYSGSCESPLHVQRVWAKCTLPRHHQAIIHIPHFQVGYVLIPHSVEQDYQTHSVSQERAVRAYGV